MSDSPAQSQLFSHEEVVAAVVSALAPGTDLRPTFSALDDAAGTPSRPGKTR